MNPISKKYKDCGAGDAEWELVESWLTVYEFKSLCCSRRSHTTGSHRLTCTRHRHIHLLKVFLNINKTEVIKMGPV